MHIIFIFLPETSLICLHIKNNRAPLSTPSCTVWTRLLSTTTHTYHEHGRSHLERLAGGDEVLRRRTPQLQRYHNILQGQQGGLWSCCANDVQRECSQPQKARYYSETRTLIRLLNCVGHSVEFIRCLAVIHHERASDSLSARTNPACPSATDPPIIRDPAHEHPQRAARPLLPRRGAHSAHPGFPATKHHQMLRKSTCPQQAHDREH